MSWETTYNQWRSADWTTVKDYIYMNRAYYPSYSWADGYDLARTFAARWGRTFPSELGPVWVYRMESDRQIAFKDYYDKSSAVWIYTEIAGDAPNWDGPVTSSLTASCGNYSVYLIGSPEITRSQTSGLKSAILGERSLAPHIIANVTHAENLFDTIKAAIQAERDLPISVQVSIKGTSESPTRIRAAIRDLVELVPRIVAAAAKTDELPDGITATIAGNPLVYPWIAAAIKGETEKGVNIVTYIVVNRAHRIYLEMENLVPQEFDLRSTPNDPSEVRDWRAGSIGS